MTTTPTLNVQVGQILKETMWLKNHEKPFVSYTRIDAINPSMGNEVLICGPGAIKREGTAMHLQIFGTTGPDGSAMVEKNVNDEWGGETVREVLPPEQLPNGFIWSDEVRPDYAGLGPERK